MGRQTGYTIVEVILFLALTGLLILVALSGFSGALNSNRKTDSTRSFAAAIEAVYSSVRSGEASRPTGTGKSTCNSQEAYPGASNVCIITGKLLYIDTSASRIDVYNIVANLTPSTPCLKDIEVFKCYNPRVLDMSERVSSITPQWGAKIGQVAFQNKAAPTATYTTMNLIAFLRHPESEIVYILPINDPSATRSGPYAIRPSDLTPNYTNTAGQICLKHDTVPVRKSYVRFNGGEGVGSIDMGDSPLLGPGVPVCS